MDDSDIGEVPIPIQSGDHESIFGRAIRNLETGEIRKINLAIEAYYKLLKISTEGFSDPQARREYVRKFNQFMKADREELFTTRINELGVLRYGPASVRDRSKKLVGDILLVSFPLGLDKTYQNYNPSNIRGMVEGVLGMLDDARKTWPNFKPMKSEEFTSDMGVHIMDQAVIVPIFKVYRKIK